jgi:ATP-dependent Clp protease adapter protein ClpS
VSAVKRSVVTGLAEIMFKLHNCGAAVVTVKKRSSVRFQVKRKSGMVLLRVK